MPNKPKKPSVPPQTTSTQIPICIECQSASIIGETPYCDHPAVKREHDPLAGVLQPTCTDERTLAPTHANRRVCGHLGVLFEKRAAA